MTDYKKTHYHFILLEDGDVVENTYRYFIPMNAMEMKKYEAYLLRDEWTNVCR